MAYASSRIPALRQAVVDFIRHWQPRTTSLHKFRKRRSYYLLGKRALLCGRRARTEREPFGLLTERANHLHSQATCNVRRRWSGPLSGPI